MFDNLSKGFKPQQTPTSDTVEEPEPADVPNQKVQLNENINVHITNQPLIAQNPPN